MRKSLRDEKEEILRNQQKTLRNRLLGNNQNNQNSQTDSNNGGGAFGASSYPTKTKKSRPSLRELKIDFLQNEMYSDNDSDYEGTVEGD